ncbi:helix-turn-helix domain-containing protein [Pontibacillus salicampi]|uniref:Helix-turn-helix domain-containing protein n=1 Tax=Pontibacillus salicampi TaxID=1449801 RepID=A0ABV6LTQ6_9BACI
MSIGKALKKARQQAGESQTVVSMEANCARESISAYETGRANTPADIFRFAMGRYKDPALAREAASNYYGTYFIPNLNGKNVDLHRCAVTMKSEEEFEEAFNALKQIKKFLTKQPSAIRDYEKQEIVTAAQEVAESMTAGFYFLSALKEYDISWNDIWESHHRELVSKGFSQAGSSRI